MQKEKLPNQLKAAIDKYVKLFEEARNKTNESNREKTELRNTVKEFWGNNNLPIGSYIHYNGFAIKYESSETKTIDNEAIFVMYENGTITRDQFLRMLKIDSTQAKNILGGDVIAELETTKIGDKADIKLERLPVEQLDDSFLVVNHKVKTKVRRKVLGQRTSTESQPVAKAKRKIKVNKRNG